MVSAAMMPPDASAERPFRALHNPGIAFDASWLETVVPGPEDLGARLERVQGPPAPTAAREVEFLGQALRCIDLTSLRTDDTDERIRALAERALDPDPTDAFACAGAAPLHVAAVCVQPAFMPAARRVLGAGPVRVCTVAAGFPTGHGTLGERVAEIEAARGAGADEIDVVIRRDLARAGAWRELYDEVRAFRGACGPVPMKVILGTGELRDEAAIVRAGAVALMAGADFLKTSTGKEAVNATLSAGIALAAAIRAYAAHTKRQAGLKAAGGITTPAQALAWLTLVDLELGAPGSGPERFRFGASSLLDGLVQRAAALRPHGA
jgi:deoxyribose-phosphate aldolase